MSDLEKRLRELHDTALAALDRRDAFAGTAIVQAINDAASIGAELEREACARSAEKVFDLFGDRDRTGDLAAMIIVRVVSAIRARGSE